MESANTIQDPLTSPSFMAVSTASSFLKLKTYSCSYHGCEKIFRYYSELSRHMKAHTNERAYKCQYCGQAFKRSDTLLNHSRLHTDNHPYACSFLNCMETFPSKARLRYHMLKHTGDKKYSCDVPGCNRTFLTSSQLNQHKKSIKYHKMIKTIPQDQSSPEISQKIEEGPESIQTQKVQLKPTRITTTETDEVVKRVLLENLILSRKVQENTQSIMTFANYFYIATHQKLLSRLLQR